MGIFDQQPDTNVPSGLPPKELIQVLVYKFARSGLQFLGYNHPNSEIMATKIVEMGEMLRILIMLFPEEEYVDRLREAIDEFGTRITQIRAERGQDWNPVYTLDLPHDELVDAFVVVATGDLIALTDRLALDRLESRL